MIGDKLEEARLRSARKRMQIVIACLAAVCLVGLAVFGLSLVDFSTKEKTKAEIGQRENVSEQETAKIREEFKESLQQYENEAEPGLGTSQAEIWNRDGVFEITELKKEMLIQFGNGDYKQALATLQVVRSRTDAILAEAERIYSENLEKAASSLAEDRYDEAKMYIDRTLVVAPNSTEALALSRQIDKLPLLLPLLKKAEIARIENDLQKEYGLLQQVVKIAPQRQKAADRLRELKTLIDRQNFAAHLSAGFTAVEHLKVEEAKSHYQKARKIDRDREELTLLSDQIASLERTLRLRRHISQAEQAVRRDDWLQARSSYTKAAEDAPDNKTVVEGLRQAGLVIDLQERLGRYLDTPYRLTHSVVRQEAEKILTEAEAGSRISFKVKQQAQQLEALIDRVTRLVTVTVISDEKTFIQIRGVGKVGAVSRRIIQLKPGEYTFEGLRTGFKSKLVQVFIPYDQDNMSIQIVCDERI